MELPKHLQNKIPSTRAFTGPEVEVDIFQNLGKQSDRSTGRGKE